MEHNEQEKYKISEAEKKALAVLALAEFTATHSGNWKQILISLLLGAGIAFFSTLFEGIADFLKEHSTEAISGSATALHYMARHMKV